MAEKHVMHRLLAGTALAGAAWMYALGPRCPFIRRFQSASRVPAAASKDPAPMVPNVPFAHRGLHDCGSGYPQKGSADASHQLRVYCETARLLARKAGYGKGAPEGASIAPENTLPAFEAACRAGYGIELDLRLSKDGKVVVFHDDSLSRAAGISATVEQFTYQQLCSIPLFSSPLSYGTSGFADSREPSGQPSSHLASWQQHVPLFADVLRLVNGRVPIIVEYKAFGRRVPRQLLEKGDKILSTYEGPYVVESFDPLAMGWYRLHRPRVIRGQLAAFGELTELVPGADERAAKAADHLGGALLADMISRPDFLAMDWHMWGSVSSSLAAAMGAQRVAWTVRSNEEALQCVDRFDRIIFEGFIPQWGVFSGQKN